MSSFTILMAEDDADDVLLIEESFGEIGLSCFCASWKMVND
jgi:hypothetical protein